MEVIQVLIIKEIEQTKDIIWFLKGYIASNPECVISNNHLDALETIINYTQRKVEDEDE